MALTACASSPSFPYDKEPNPAQIPYVIGAADVVEVGVYEHDEFSASQTVRPDGVITLPLVGDIQAAGSSAAELEKIIRERLRRFVKDDPTVNVAVTEVHSYHVTVTGEVGAPGRFEAANFMRVADAVALAGGPTPFASPSDAFILRRDDQGNMRKIPIDYDGVAAGERPEQNIYLVRGDQVIVP